MDAFLSKSCPNNIFSLISAPYVRLTKVMHVFNQSEAHLSLVLLELNYTNHLNTEK